MNSYLTADNYALFTRQLELKCNNQFEILNENFRAYNKHHEMATNSIVDMLNKINKTLTK
jgi:hypothetical protein